MNSRCNYFEHKYLIIGYKIGKHFFVAEISFTLKYYPNETKLDYIFAIVVIH